MSLIRTSLRSISRDFAIANLPIIDIRKEFFLERIGEGRASTVFKATSKRDPRKHAYTIKIATQRDAELSAFIRALNVSKKLCSIADKEKIHVVCYDELFATTSLQLGFSMNFVTGVSLDKMHGITPYKVAKKIALEVLRTLSVLHSYGIVHGDVKPANIMWDDVTSRITLIDLDAVQTSDDATISCASATTCSPEVARFMIDPKLENFDGVPPIKVLKAYEVWAACVTLFSIFNGVDPWHLFKMEDKPPRFTFLNALEILGNQVPRWS